MSSVERRRKNYYRRNKSNFFLLLILVIFLGIIFYNDVFETFDVDIGFHINILTINSIFAGFLFTSLGIMIGILDKERISRLDKAGYMDNYFNAIYIGLFFHVISILISLILVITPGMEINQLLTKLEQTTLFLGISFFVKSIINVLKIIKMVREN